jgi:biotin carboxyl carrier protein
MSTQKERWKISGKRVEMPAAATDAGAGANPVQWKLTPRPGGWILAESSTGERRRLMATELKGKLSAAVGGYLYHGDIARDARGGAAAGGGSDSDLIAQFPGKVRKVLVVAGATVAEGDPLVLVEAMKMEFAIKAPYAGVVKRVCVAEAQQLSPGDRFVEMEISRG